MGRGKLTKEEMKIFVENPYVVEVNEQRIVYSEEFKRYFMQEYLAGKGPTQIFREAGFDKEIIGSKRIERAASRWKEGHFAEKLSEEEKTYMDVQKVFKRLQKMQKQIQELQSENEVLREQIQLIMKGKDCT